MRKDSLIIFSIASRFFLFFSSYLGAQRLFEFLLRHDPHNCSYWTSLAICYEMQITPVSSPLQANVEQTSNTAPTQPSADSSSPPPSSSAPSNPTVNTPAQSSPSSSSVPPSSTSTPLVDDSHRVLESLYLKDLTLRKNVRYCLEKARFYETLERGKVHRLSTSPSSVGESGATTLDSGATSPPSSSSDHISYLFRLTLAQNLLAAGRSEVSNLLIRHHHYDCCENLLLSLKDLVTPIRAAVHATLGDLYTARGLSALLDPPESGGGAEASKRFKVRALVAYTKALEYDPFHTTAWNQLSVLFMQSGDMKHALTYLARLVKILKQQLGLSAVKAEATDSPLLYTPLTPTDLQSLVDADPSHRRQLASVLCNLGITLQLTARHTEAESCYLDSARLAADAAPTYMNLGNLYRELARTEDALRAFSRALSIKPDYAMAWCNLALVYIQTESWINAYHFMEKAFMVRNA